MFKEKIIPTGKVFYSDLIPELEHFFTTREAFLKTKGTDLEKELVEKNKKLTAEYLNIKENNLISPTQTHSSNIDIADIGKNDYPETDSLILTNKEQAVFLNFADCVPVIIYDKKHNIGAIAHAGWRGTVDRIAPKTIEKIISITNDKDFNNIYAVIGPSISSCCYNVGEEVIEKVKEAVKNHENLFRITDEKVFVDLKMVNFKQLTELGIPEKNIDICPYCTCCQNDLFFSYRKENGTTNRHNAVIRLK